MKVADTGGGDFNLETGIYNAVCFGLIDVGTQDNDYGGEHKKQHQIIMKFELLDEFYEHDGEQFRSQFSQFYTLSLGSKANLRKHLVGWRGKEFTAEELQGFELRNILGKNCVLVIGLTESGKPKIESISKYKGTPEESTRDLEYFSFEDFDGEFPEFMSDGIKRICVKSEEYADSKGVSDAPSGVAEEPQIDNFDDDIPF